MKLRWSTMLLTAMLCAGYAGIGFAQNSTIFGPNVYVFSPGSDTTTQATLISLSNEAQFSTNRYAVLFQPGTYTVQAPVGFYESINGLGENPNGVTINGFLTPNYGTTPHGANVTTTFWRSMENMTFNPATDSTQGGPTNTLQWGVSQGASLRRLQINGGLELTDSSCGEASGGFISDTVVTGSVNPCSQQQWYTRNSSLGSWSGGIWNMVFSGVQGAPTPNYPTNSYTVVPTTPVSREKPFLYVDGSGDYNVFVPTVQTNSSGTTWSYGTAPGYSVPISNFFIAQPSTALADINIALAYGKNLILTPGIYQYNGSINVTNPNTIVLGLGYATLVPQAGTAAITVADVDGVQIAGLIIDAGPISSPVLLQVGVSGGPRVSHQSNPTSISDVCFRIGGATVGTAATSIEVDSNNVIIDNMWAWRADHGAGASPIWTGNAAENGVVINGDYVTALGLAVEHYEGAQVLWNGNGGETIFYQSELPYDVPSQSLWMDGSANGYPSYVVSNSVTTHTAYGLGVYSYFSQGIPIVEDNAITVPNAVGVTVTDAVSVFLAGSGQITATIDNVGTVAKSGTITSYVPFYQGVACSTTCPAAASNLDAIPISPTQINLTWTASSTPGVLYNVFRSTTAGFTPSAGNRVASTATGTSFADTTATPSTTYYYVIQAHSSAGSSGVSNQATATTTVNNGGLITTDVLKIDSAYASGTIPTGWVADEYFTGGNKSSTTHAITIPGSVVNPAPAAVYQTNRNSSSFSYAIPGLTPGTSYIVDFHFAEVYFSTAGSRAFNVAINGTSVLKNFDILATAGAEYTANVQSFYAVADATGTITINFSAGSVNSPEVSGIEIGQSNLPVPVAPTGLAAFTVSDSQINLSWNASSTTGVQYEVFRSTTPGFVPSPSNLITTTANTAYSDTALAPSTTYYYVVEANDAFFTSLPSNPASATSESGPVAPPSMPAAPTALTASTISSSQINLFWTGSATPSVQYEVYRSTTPGFTGSTGSLVATTSATGYSDTGLTAATTYYYLVEATNTVGTSQASNQAGATTSGGAGTVVLQTSPSLAVQGDGSYQATVTITNTGTGTAQNVVLTGLTIGTTKGTPVPYSLGSIAPNASAIATLSIPAIAGAPGSHVVMSITGTYTGGAFGGSVRTTLP